MIREVLQSIGLKLREVSLGHIYTGMGVLSASGAILFVKVGEAQSIPELVSNPVNWIALAGGTVIFIVVGILVQAAFSLLGRLLCAASSWYPNWFYFPRIEAEPEITSIKEIELTLTNPSHRRAFTLQAAYARLHSNVKPLPSLAMGVAPSSHRIIFPLDKMPPGARRKRVIGTVSHGKVLLAMGRNAEERMELSHPGTYEYHFSVSGDFRGRSYDGGSKFTIVIRENGEVSVRG